MNNALKIAIGLFVITILGAIAISFSGKEKTDWRETYNNLHKIPFGTYVLHQELETLFPEQEITTLPKNSADYFNEFYNYYDDNYSIKGNYIYIDNNMFTFDHETSIELLNFVSNGNKAFIATDKFQETLMDSLNFDFVYPRITYASSDTINNVGTTIWLNDKNFNGKMYHYKKNSATSYFDNFNQSKVRVLGKQKINDTIRPNFIEVPYGDGAFYLHAQPIAFTNYYLLNGNQKYVSDLFSYLDDATVYWDPHYSFRKGGGNNKSSLSYFLSHKALKWAFLLALFSIIIFVVFNAKRKQRIIPIIKPLENTTLDFTQTIGNLYFQQNNHNDIVQRKIIFFLEKIRNDYFLDTNNLNDDFIEKLSLKSGKKYGEVRLVVNTILKLNNKLDNTEDDLLRLNQLIEKFFRP